MAESGNLPDHVKYHAIVSAEALTEPGGALLEGVETCEPWGNWRQAGKWGPSAHPDDLEAMIPRALRNVVDFYPFYRDYRKALARSDLPYNVSMTNPGPKAVQAWQWQWLEQLEPPFRKLLHDLEASVQKELPHQKKKVSDEWVQKIQHLLAVLRGPGGVKIPDGNEVLSSGPGIHPTDLLSIVQEAGYRPERLWGPAASDYLSISRTFWRRVPEEIRQSGTCLYRNEP